MINKQLKIIATLLFLFLMCTGIVYSKPTEKELSVFKDKLDKKIKIKIKSEPLEDFFIRLRKVCKIPIVSSAKVDLKTIIKVSFNEISAKDAIYWVCKKYYLDYEVKRGALYFLDLDESLKKNSLLKTYDIKFLNQRFLQENPFLSSAILNHLIRDNGGASISYGDDDEDEGDSSLYIGSRIDTILRHKIPEGNWDSEETSILVSGGSLRVKNTLEIQDKVKALLKFYHEKYGLQVQSKVMILSVPKKDYNEYILKDLKGSNILSAEGMNIFISKKLKQWQKTHLLFSGTTASYNACVTNISLSKMHNSLSDYEVIDNKYDPVIENYWNDDGVSIYPLVSRDQSKIILSLTGQYSTLFEMVTPDKRKSNIMESVDKIRGDVVKFSTSMQIPTGGGVLISVGSNALKDMNDQLIIFCISSKVNLKP